MLGIGPAVRGMLGCLGITLLAAGLAWGLVIHRGIDVTGTKSYLGAAAVIVAGCAVFLLLGSERRKRKDRFPPTANLDSSSFRDR